MTSRARRRTHDQRGAVVSVWTAVIAVTMVAVLAVAVDLSGLVRAKQAAADAAAQAARQAGQQLSTGTLFNTGRLEVRTQQAKTAALDYLKAIGMTGTTTVRDGTTLIVTDDPLRRTAPEPAPPAPKPAPTPTPPVTPVTPSNIGTPTSA